MILKFPISQTRRKTQWPGQNILRQIGGYWRARRSRRSLDKMPDQILKDVLSDYGLQIREESRRRRHSNFPFDR
ncbi:DUF1127 domain-containing protein [Labrenzia sp. PHM005]|nr:DUF1127 domain-containing protein [Labrenzia sp. PHM005]